METTKATPTTIDYLRTGRPDSDIERIGPDRFPFARPLSRIVCEDGFSLSVQAGSLLYATPRTDKGPWTAVEVGFPSARPEPWNSWAEYAEETDKPTDTVYGYVPLTLVEALVALHGGEVPA